jgi:hypothetical protein
VSNSEDDLENGISVNASSSNLLTNATDVDDDNGTLVIGEVKGDPTNVASAVTVTLNYTDADGAAQSQDIDLTVSGDGSYGIASVDLDALPAGENATGTFTYNRYYRHRGRSQWRSYGGQRRIHVAGRRR